MRLALRVWGWAAAASVSCAASANVVVDRLASGATAVPEPGDLALFLLGVTGLIVGRRASRIRADRKRRELDGQQ